MKLNGVDFETYFKHYPDQQGYFGKYGGNYLEDPELITIRYLDRFNAEFLWGADFDYKLDFLAAVVAKLENNERGTLKLTKDGEARFIME